MSKPLRAACSVLLTVAFGLTSISETRAATALGVVDVGATDAELDLFGDQAAWAIPRGRRRVDVFRGSATGGAAQHIRYTAAEPDVLLDIQASSSTIVLELVSDMAVSRGGGAFSTVPDTAPVAVIGDDLVTNEPDGTLTNRPATGAPVPIPLPAGADARYAAVNGDAVAVPIESVDGEVRTVTAVAVIARNTGTVQRTVAVPASRGMYTQWVGLQADGGIAVVASNSIFDLSRLFWAPAGASAAVRLPEPVGEGYLPIFALAESRFATIQSARPRGRAGYERLVVLDLPDAPGDGAAAPVVFRGPDADSISGLDIESGGRVGWATPTCVFSADLADGDVLEAPAGPCFRADADLGPDLEKPIGKRRPSYPLYFDCISVVGSVCPVKIALSYGGEVVGRARVRVPEGRRQSLRVTLRGRDASRIRRDRESVDIVATVSDGAGGIREFTD